MAPLIVRIKKKSDGSAALSCQRADGTVTWQRQEGLQGQFFPLHDLTHYAVETVLGVRQGFFGLVARGWNLTDFGIPWPRGRLPREAATTELIVGFLDAERAAGTRWTAAELNEKLGSDASMSDSGLAAIRRRRAELFREWDATASGATLELRFDI